MMPDTLITEKTLLRIERSSIIGLPSPSAIRADRFPGVSMGPGPEIGAHCIIFGNVFIGNQFRCGDNVFIRENTAIGDKVTIGAWSFIDAGVAIADNARIGEEVWIPRDARIGSGAVIGPRVQFICGPDYPDQSAGPANSRTKRRTILEDGCIIGKDAVIGDGVCIGAGAVVEDGAVVTRDMPGVPETMKR